MPLAPCRECGKEISTTTKVCPNCGYTRKGRSGVIIPGIVVGGIIVALLNSGSHSPSTQTPAVQGSQASDGSQSAQTQPPPICQNNWHACKDNADLVNNSLIWGDVRAACEMAVDNNVRYGTPKWPGFMAGGPFESFVVGNNYISTGVVTAIEPDVQVQNAFSAMVHSTARCQYDLNTKTVTNVSIDSN